MVWGIPSRLDRLGCSDSDISASSGVEENSWSQSSKIGRAQRRDKRHPASSAKDRVSPWFEELFTHREKPAKKARKSNGNVKPRRCSCHPRSSQEWGLALLGVLLVLYLIDFFSLLYKGSAPMVIGHPSPSVRVRSTDHVNLTVGTDLFRDGRNGSISSFRHGNGTENRPKASTVATGLERRFNGKQSERNDTYSAEDVSSSLADDTLRRAEYHHSSLPTSPMNGNMVDLQVPGNLGELTIDEVKTYYRKLAKAYLDSFSKGIYRQMYFDVLRRRTYSLTPPGANKGVQAILFQIVSGKVFMMDPYEVPRNSKPFYRTRINQVIWLLSKLAREQRIKDTEFLMAIHDCVQTVNKPHDYRGAHYQESNPAFTIVSCNFSDNIPFPMWEGSKHRDGGFSVWDVTVKRYAQDDVPWDQKQDRAVFRGGNRPSMYFKNKTEADFHCHDVGRTRLQYLSHQQPDVLDVSIGGTCGGVHTHLDRLEPHQHHRYKYILYAEGNCMWADRSRIQVFGPSVIIKQETPCGQFFEPLMKPNIHYIPTDFFFSDTVEKVLWARAHDEIAHSIVSNANDFAQNFLSLDGIEAYVEVLLDEYTQLLVEPDVKIENGAVEVTNRRV